MTAYKLFQPWEKLAVKRFSGTCQYPNSWNALAHYRQRHHVDILLCTEKSHKIFVGFYLFVLRQVDLYGEVEGSLSLNWFEPVDFLMLNICYFSFFVQLLVIFLDQRHIFWRKNTQLSQQFPHSMLNKSVGMQIDGRHYLQIFLELVKYFMFIEEDRPRLDPPWNWQYLFHTKYVTEYPERTITGVS